MIHTKNLQKRLQEIENKKNTSVIAKSNPGSIFYITQESKEKNFVRKGEVV